MKQDSKTVMSNTVDKTKRWGQKTDQEKYLEWVNDWLTVSACAENYGLTDKELLEILERGKSANEMAAYVALKKENEELKEQMAQSMRLYECQNNTIIKLQESNRVLVEALDEAINRVAYCIDLWAIPDEAVAMLRGEIDAMQKALQSNQ